jgi:pSer/pThr/pTyr-binding forkhead associated (FHA) protein
VAETYVAVPDPGAALPRNLQYKNAQFVPMKDPPGVPYTLELQWGALYGRDLDLDVFLPHGFVELTGEYLVEVDDDGAATIRVLEGQGNYFPADGSGEIPIHADHRILVQDGHPSDTAVFNAAGMERWWAEGSAVLGSSLAASLGPMLLVGACATPLILLVAGLSMVLILSNRRRRQPAARSVSSPASPTQQRAPAEPSAVPSGQSWGALSVVHGAIPPTALTLDKPVFTIGRSTASDLVLPDVLMSRQHAQIRRGNGGVILQDLASTNGTFVNGQRLFGSCALHPGDVIRVGHTELIFQPAYLEPGSQMAGGQLVLTWGDSAPPVVDLRTGVQLSIGRSRTNDVVIRNDPHVSRQHAVIRRTAQGHEIFDLDSKAGVLVNGERVLQAHLHSGDRIRLSRTEFVYQSG